MQVWRRLRIVQVTLSSGILSLEQFASADCRDAESARGRCLDATVELGREALRLGVAQQVAFVRWHVLNDPDFMEHWALVLDDGRVIDPTAVQVDGDPRALRRMDEYPANYVSPRRYPVDSLVPMLDAGEPANGWRYSRRQMWSLHRWMFRHDVQAGVRARSPRDLAEAGRTLACSAFALAVDAALEWAVNRAAKVQARRVS